MKKMVSALMSMMLVACLAPGTALAYSNDTATESTSVATQGKVLSPQAKKKWTSAQKKALKKIKGTWTGASYASGAKTMKVKIKGAKLKVYDGKKLTNTIKIKKVKKFNENGTKGWKFFTLSNDWAYYLANGKPDELPIYLTSDGYGRITDYNMYSPTRNGLTRVK